MAAPVEASDGKPLVLMFSRVLLALDAGERHLNIQGQGLSDHLGIEGPQVMPDPAQQFEVGDF